MKLTIRMLVVLAVFQSGSLEAAKCKFEIDEPGHVESRMVLFFRGGLVGLQGFFGIKDGERYLRGLYGSNFKAKAHFFEETPLQLTLADGREITLDVIVDASAKLQIGHYITVSRQAEPFFAVTDDQWTALQESPIVGLHMTFDAKGERRSETREVKSKHAEKIQAALECVAQSSSDDFETDEAR